MVYDPWSEMRTLWRSRVMPYTVHFDHTSRAALIGALFLYRFRIRTHSAGAGRQHAFQGTHMFDFRDESDYI